MEAMQDGTVETEHAGERYDAARAHLAYLIDNPDKSVSVDEYRAQLATARKATAAAHKAMLAERRA